MGREDTSVAFGLDEKRCDFDQHGTERQFSVGYRLCEWLLQKDWLGVDRS
jgi:hypothetical protein